MRLPYARAVYCVKDSETGLERRCPKVIETAFEVKDSETGLTLCRISKIVRQS